MTNSLKLSAIALLTTALTVLPAHALSLNLGNDDAPLVDLGNDNNADATVSVDTDGGSGSNTNGAAAVNVNLGGGDGGGSDGGDVVNNGGTGGVVNLGGDGGLVNLGNANDNDDGLFDIELGNSSSGGGTSGGTGGLLDLGGDGDLIDLNDGGNLLDLSGNGDSDTVIRADIGGGDGGLLDLGTTGSIIDLGESGSLLDLGGGSGDLIDLGNGDGNLLDLGDGAQEQVAANLLGTKAKAKVNLSGDDKPVVDIKLGTGSDGVAGTGVAPDTSGSVTVGGDNAASVSVTTGGGDGNDSGNNDDGGNGGNGNGSGGGNGSIGGAGGSDGGGSAGNGTGGTAGGNGGGNGSGNGSGSDLFAAAPGNACLTLTAAQLDELIQRHAYNSETFNSWASARSLKIVEVDVCDREVAGVEAAADGSANVARLQAFLAAQAKVQAGLQSKGYSSGDVIAADNSGEVLIVYVI